MDEQASHALSSSSPSDDLDVLLLRAKKLMENPLLPGDTRLTSVPQTVHWPEHVRQECRGAVNELLHVGRRELEKVACLQRTILDIRENLSRATTFIMLKTPQLDRWHDGLYRETASPKKVIDPSFTQKKQSQGKERKKSKKGPPPELQVNHLREKIDRTKGQIAQYEAELPAMFSVVKKKEQEQLEAIERIRSTARQIDVLLHAMADKYPVPPPVEVSLEPVPSVTAAVSSKPFSASPTDRKRKPTTASGNNKHPLMKTQTPLSHTYGQAEPLKKLPLVAARDYLTATIQALEKGNRADAHMHYGKLFAAVEHAAFRRPEDDIPLYAQKVVDIVHKLIIADWKTHEGVERLLSVTEDLKHLCRNPLPIWSEFIERMKAIALTKLRTRLHEINAEIQRTIRTELDTVIKTCTALTEVAAVGDPVRIGRLMQVIEVIRHEIAHDGMVDSLLTTQLIGAHRDVSCMEEELHTRRYQMWELQNIQHAKRALERAIYSMQKASPS